MNLVYRGTAAYLVGERRYPLEPGSMLWLFPGQNHILVDESKDIGIWFIVARPPVAASLASKDPRYAALAEPDPAGGGVRTIGSADMARTIDLLSLVASQCDDLVCFNSGIAYAAAALWRLFLLADESESVSLHPAVARAVRLIEDDVEGDTIGTLARAAGLSPSRLSRLFHAQIGMPIARFRNTRRLERFQRHRERAPGASLSLAAMEAGFGSYAQFYRVYRAAYGRGPASEVRNPRSTR